MLVDGIPTRVRIDFHYNEMPRELGDCRTQAFCMILNHYGYEITAQEIFGIGSGLDFHIKNINYNGFDLPLISGRNFDAENNCCKILQIPCKEQTLVYNSDISSGNLCFDRDILEILVEGRPVLIQCDVYYMTYLSDIKRNHNQYHMIIILGFDLESREFTVLDSVSGQVHTIAMSQLYMSMFEKYYGDEKVGIWYDIKQPENICNQRKQIDKYIESFMNQGNSIIKNDGYLEEIKKYIDFLNRIRECAKQGSVNHDNYLKFILEMNCILIRKQDELNGSCFRHLYEKYLNEVSTHLSLNNELWNDLVMYIQQSEAAFKALSFKVRYYNGTTYEKCEMFIQNLEKIYKAEKELGTKLMNIRRNLQDEK
ncbi:hypothetical protein acsn021_07670 [Anaerocolumna cellulosilytica]|uniref:Uncharacterized protein n=1 Tax=Anaerocolumna cellulosilytica TaxID=433286 RepID=A0A6S6R2E4_9FIRM|nr:BtrH N-terminal domain-containing protein [Anaerocolumna cellulosilytica]MBB5197623.1 hypothetical protein [Anaerocolumna cellulosilytica]BCJ93198.1 hypothetical protein acsn021_07670 [Anaerocolumna cellulosilytica]